jgi:putative tRNA adenosine deaminase-associated protein
MSDVSDVSSTDFALAVSRDDEGRWDVDALPLRAAADLDALVAALTQLSAEGGVLGLVSVADDFFVAVLVRGEDVSLLLSDASAATDWPLAHDVLDELDLPVPDDDDEDTGPAGDVDMFEELGVPAIEIGAICGDDELYPDEMLGRIATRLGFGEQFELAIAAERR